MHRECCEGFLGMCGPLYSIRKVFVSLSKGGELETKVQTTTALFPAACKACRGSNIVVGRWLDDKCR